MAPEASVFITLGLLFLIGLATNYIGRHTFVPRVSALLLVGVLIGPSMLDFLPDPSGHGVPYIADMALAMVGFMLGSALNLKSLKKYGRCVFSISIAIVLVSSTVVCAGLYLMGLPLHVALLLGGIATATDPAATSDVVREVRGKGPFSSTLLGIVAVDDAWGLIVFSLMLAASQVVTGGGELLDIIGGGAWEIVGALMLGLFLGVPMSYLTGRIQLGEPTFVEALGMIFLCAGLAIYLHVSYLLASMCMGAVVSNTAKHHKRPFHAIENVEWSLLVLFFVFAGASLRLETLFHVGLIVPGYILLRVLARIIGAHAGGLFCNVNRQFLGWMGMALMPQAGVALGMALVASRFYPEHGEILQIVVVATVVFEIVGPLLTRLALKRVGECVTQEK